MARHRRRRWNNQKHKKWKILVFVFCFNLEISIYFVVIVVCRYQSRTYSFFSLVEKKTKYNPTCSCTEKIHGFTFFLIFTWQSHWLLFFNHFPPFHKKKRKKYSCFLEIEFLLKKWRMISSHFQQNKRK